MLKFLSRVAGFGLLVAAFAQVVVDGARSIAGGSLSLTPLGALVETLAPGRWESWGARFGETAPGLWRLLSGAPAVLALALAAIAALLSARSKSLARPGYEAG
jgi:hypothetical protein